MNASAMASPASHDHAMSNARAEPTCVAAPEAEGLSSAVVDRLVEAYPYYVYRYWKGFGGDVPQRLLRWELLHGHEDPVRHWRVLLIQGDEVDGVAWVASRPWESEQLGVPVGSLRHLIVRGPTGSVRQRNARVLLSAVLTRVTGHLVCVSHAVDPDDSQAIAALQAERFNLADTAVSFVCGREVLERRLPSRCVIRDVQTDDADQLERLACVSYFGGRFYHDPRIDPQAADALYRAWVRQCHRKVFADEMVVAVRHGLVVGFLAYQFQRALLAAAGIKVAGRGLLAVAPEHRGVALDLLRAGISKASASADFGQFDIHVTNVELLRLYARTLRMGVAHIRHTFHRWLDESPR